MSANMNQFDQIIAGIEEFLTRHVTRLSEVLDQCAEARAQEAAAQQLADELQRQIAQWERQRQGEATQIEQEQLRLITAWEHLEAEERRLAALAESFRGQGNAAGWPGLEQNEAPAAENRGFPAVQPRATRAANAAAATAENRSLVFDRATESASSRQQFERLKREIRNHTRRSAGAD
jgi:hypothetical protein